MMRWPAPAPPAPADDVQADDARMRVLLGLAVDVEVDALRGERRQRLGFDVDSLSMAVALLRRGAP